MPKAMATIIIGKYCFFINPFIDSPPPHKMLRPFKPFAAFPFLKVASKAGLCKLTPMFFHFFETALPDAGSGTSQGKE